MSGDCLCFSDAPHLLLPIFLYIFSIVLLGINSAVAQTTTNEVSNATSSLEVKVTLCDLMAHPSDYADKPVTVRATLASGVEFSIFADKSRRGNLGTHGTFSVRFYRECPSAHPIMSRA